MSITSTQLLTLMGMHTRYQKHYTHYMAAYAAALTGLRLAPQLAAQSPIQPHKPSRDDFLNVPDIHVGDISFRYIKTSTHIYSYASQNQATCLLKRRSL